MDRTARIRALNDAFRCGRGNAPVFFTEFTITRGVAAHGEEFVEDAMAAVVSYEDFTADNDPYGEHDFGAFDIDDQRLFWKIDYYDTDLKFGSPDPSDPSVTRRVLTILLASEY